MRTVVFGGTGGLGRGLQNIEWRYERAHWGPMGPIYFLGSKDLDITDYDAVGRFFAEQTYDVVINLAGVNVDGVLHKQTAEGIERVIKCNLLGAANILHHALPGMRSRDFGRIILASSYLVAHPLVGTSVYAASKAALEHLAATCALENARHHITCNVLRLGYFDGGLTNTVPGHDLLPSRIPAGRLGRIDELGKALAFLIETEYVNGAVIPMTGGL